MYNCRYKVYKRTKGEPRVMLARFLEKVDAANFAFDQSKGKFRNIATLTVVNDENKVIFKYENGIRH